ncbi:MAG: copper amine oxidase N-terminal domain-containing protein [Bacillota bacterium]
MTNWKKAVSVSVITAFLVAGPTVNFANAQKPEAKQGKVDIKVEVKTENEKGKQEVKNEKNTETKENRTLDKSQIKELKMQMKEVAKSRYSQEELEKLKLMIEEIQQQNEDVTIIPVENIISRKMNLKFDTPPVIKQGRTLIPVRAISEGFGAEVAWNAEEQKVTVTKDDIEIVFLLEEGKVLVNGEEKTIDVPAQIMSSRTIVPLRFIAETLGLKVDYDEETETIEVDEEDGTTDEEATEEATDETDDQEDVDDTEETSDDQSSDTTADEDTDESDEIVVEVEDDEDTDESDEIVVSVEEETDTQEDTQDEQ